MGIPTIALSITPNQDCDVTGFYDLGMCLKSDLSNIKGLIDIVNNISYDDRLRLYKNSLKINGNGDLLKRRVLDFINEC